MCRKRVNVLQTGKDLDDQIHMKWYDILYNVFSYFMLQFIPVFAIIIIVSISSKVVLDYKILIENMIIVCVVSNATSINNNYLIIQKKDKGKLSKVLMFARILIVCIGSIIYTLFLVDDLIGTDFISIDYNVALIPSVIIVITTFVIAYLSIVDGGEI